MDPLLMPEWLRAKPQTTYILCKVDTCKRPYIFRWPLANIVVSEVTKVYFSTLILKDDYLLRPGKKGFFFFLLIIIVSYCFAIVITMLLKKLFIILL